MMNINKSYWNKLYINNALGWDIGYASPPIKQYIDQLIDKNLKILIPGGGNGYEADYILKKGFKNIRYLDYSESAVSSFKKKFPEFPAEQIFCEDFFEHQNHYDLIIELAFFTSIIPEQRGLLAQKIFDLLNIGGKYVGLFFNHEFKLNEPPFGAIKETYLELLIDKFSVKTFGTSYNSIKPRAGRELFFIFQKLENGKYL
jgi:thiopurine S-methyltransferase